MAKIVTLRDDWTEGIDAGRWNKWGGDNVTVAANVVTCVSDDGPINYFGVSSQDTFDLTDSSVSIEVISLPTIDTEDSTASCTILAAEIDADNRLFWDIDAYGLHAYVTIDGNYVPLMEIPYNPTTHKFLRIREQGGLVYFGFSADGVTWSEPYVSTYTGLDITAVNIDFSIGNYAPIVNGPYQMQLGAVNLYPAQTGNFNWKGYEWVRRSDYGAPHYANNWAQKNVLPPDANDRVTLYLSNDTGSDPIAAEFYANGGTWGYGTYQVVIESNASLAAMHKSIVIGGLFTYGAATDTDNEIDSGEISAWDNASGDVVLGHTLWEPDGLGGKVADTNSEPVGTQLIYTHRIVWTPDSVTIDTYEGEGTGGTNVLHTEYTTAGGDTIPVPGGEIPHFNLWVANYGDNDETSAGPFEIYLRNFYFSPYAEGVSGIKVWNGSGWVTKPVKVWNGSEWEQKPVKRWNGSTWVED